MKWSFTVAIHAQRTFCYRIPPQTQMIIAIFMFLFSLCVLQQFLSCSYPIFEPLCGSFYPSYGIGMHTFSTMPVGMLITPINSAPCCFSGRMRNLPLVSLPEEVESQNVVEYKDQTKIVNDMVSNQNFTSLTKSSLDDLLETYGSLRFVNNAW